MNKELRVCQNCKQTIMSPVEHEFCSHADRPHKQISIIHSKGQPPHYCGRYPKPKQKHISNNLQSTATQVPKHHGLNHYDKDWDLDAGTRQDVARKIFEEL